MFNGWFRWLCQFVTPAKDSEWLLPSGRSSMVEDALVVSLVRVGQTRSDVPGCCQKLAMRGAREIVLLCTCVPKVKTVVQLKELDVTTRKCWSGVSSLAPGRV